MLKVLKSGFYASIQDKGRSGFASVGVPVSGVMDTYSSDLANSILNNPLDLAVLEITFGNCEFQFLKKTIICISGADFSAKLNGIIINLNSKIIIQPNDILSFGKMNFGARTYVAVKHGFLSEKRLKSRSYFKNITKDFIIRKNDLIAYTDFKLSLTLTNTSVKINQNHFRTPILECFKGPEFDKLNQNQRYKLLHQEFTISMDNSRMGYKLEEVLENNLPQILTSAVFPGTVQLTPSGKMIILMRDCQVTGGYPRVLQFSEESINRLGQKSTGAKIQFVIN